MTEIVAMFVFAGAIGLAGGVLGVYNLRRQGTVKIQKGKPRPAPRPAPTRRGIG